MYVLTLVAWLANLPVFVVALSYNSAFFGGNTNLPILIDNLQCRGNESNITQCVFETHTADCSHLEDAGIKCYPIDGMFLIVAN